jgi:alpha-galactosidase
MGCVDLQNGLDGFAGPGHWNDPDMLEVGNGGMTGNDLRDMRPEIRAILTNKEVIAVDQDPLGREGKRVRKNDDLEVWAKQMKDGSRAVVLFNRGSEEHEITVNWEDLGYPDHLSAAVRDLWLKQDVGRFAGKLTASVPSHGVVMVMVKL